MRLHVALIACGMVVLSLLAGGCVQQGAEAQVSLREWKVEIKDTQRPPGEVVFMVTNYGDQPHILRVEGQGVQQQTRRIEPGGSDVLSVRLERGVYELFSPFAQDKQKGMDIKLQVGAPQQ